MIKTTKTRDVIFEALHTAGRLSVNELAEHAEVSPVTVRHHLTALQAQGLVQSTETRGGVGRPKLLYSLTETALEQHNPRKYARLSRRLLDEMKSALPAGVVSDILTRIARKRAAHHVSDLHWRSFEDRIASLVALLGEEGFMAEWDSAGDAYYLTEHNCPYFRLGKSHPEVCTFDQILISEVLEVPVERTTCLLDGDDQCVFEFSNPQFVQTVE
ncbi:MAG: helix-turn-helix transcriptional regulator [Anaerolineales bacterium]